MKAFVTGGTGFIGSHLTDRLLEEKRFTEVRCLVRKSEKWLAGKSYSRIDGDLFDLPALKKGLTGVSTLFHIAAIVKAPSAAEFQRANVDATENLIRLALDCGVDNIVVLSSLAAAGPSSDRPLTEEDPLRPVSMYGRSKKEMERMIHNVAPDRFPLTILRPPAVYGPREDQIYTWFQMANRRICPIVGDGHHPKLSLVHVSDLVHAISTAGEQKRSGINTYFVSGPEITNWNRIRDITAGILDKRPLSLYVRPGLVKGIANIVEKSASLFGVYPVLNREKANEMILQWTCNDSKARLELQYEPQVSLEDGLAQTLHWYKQHHWL